MSALEAALAYPDRPVLLTWPTPSWMASPENPPPSFVGQQVVSSMRPGNLLFYVHGRDEEPGLLKIIHSYCRQIGSDVELPNMPAPTVLRVFRKLNRPYAA